MISGHREILSRSETQDLGLSAFIPKPIDLDELRQVVEQVERNVSVRKEAHGSL
jgi:DNA-binding NtrC family response regulator